MNCPVRTEPFPDEGHNQNPPELAAELTTRRSLNTPRNAHGTQRIDLEDGSHAPQEETQPASKEERGEGKRGAMGVAVQEVARGQHRKTRSNGRDMLERTISGRNSSNPPNSRYPGYPLFKSKLEKLKDALVKYAKFIGPGFMVAVAYIDPGNYATDVAAGASFRYRLLFIVLLSNLFAIFLQSLCIKLGTVTGLNLAECCRAFLPRWLNYVLYVFAEAAIIATDIAEVIGTAIALNILLKIPLVAGCAISIVDVLVILVFYSPAGMSMRGLRAFELFVILLVLGVVICFCYELSKIRDTTIGEVFKGYLPSSALVKPKGLYQACGILGATVMPHSLYLGSGIVQNRLRDFDVRHNNFPDTNKSATTLVDDTSSVTSVYKPSLSAIKNCLAYSVVELALSLFTFALFVNSAILIVAGASLSNLPEKEIDDVDLFSIHNLLVKSVAPAAGTIFALALLLSGTSAGIVCTIAGQMVSEGQLTWTVRPWIRRLITRLISIVPSIIIAGAVGRKGLGSALEASQVALSVILPFVSAPLIYFTWNAKIMKVEIQRRQQEVGVQVPLEHQSGNQGESSAQDMAGHDAEQDRVAGAGHEDGQLDDFVVMKNNWFTGIIALGIWGIMTTMNVALLVLLGLGK